LPVVSLLITSWEFAITKIMAEITPIGSIDSHDIFNPPHFFLLQLGRRRRRRRRRTKPHHPKQREPQQLQQERERERASDRTSSLRKTCDPQTLVGVVFFLFSLSLSRQTKAISL
jgi:hypothetical protein